jgi:pimeloyl-ACP methyl ester carboxylesterase
LSEVIEARERGAILVDARPRHLFLGEQGVTNTGHIPGARCLPYQELVDGATGLWGAPATVAMLALERIGVHCDGVYDGSFNEWGADRDRPVEYGAAA